MAKQHEDSFLALVLANARREEARGVLLTVERAMSRIDLLLLDGSCRQLSAPPSDILLKIIESLEQGETRFSSKVYEATVVKVTVQRGSDSMRAEIEAWEIEHL